MSDDTDRGQTEIDPGQHEEFLIHPTIQTFAQDPNFDPRSTRQLEPGDVTSRGQAMENLLGMFSPFQAMKNPDTPEARAAYDERLKSHQPGKMPPVPGSPVINPTAAGMMDVAGNVAGAAGGAASKMLGSKAMFVGVKPIVETMGNMLERLGMSEGNLKRYLGIERGAEGFWRQEISDQPAHFTNNLPSPRLVSDSYNPALLRSNEKLHPGQDSGHWEDGTPDPVSGQVPLHWIPGTSNAGQWISKSVPLESVYDHPELYRAYPEARNIRVALEPEEEMESAGRRAYFNTDDNYIGISQGLTEEERRSSLLHELQHWVQHKEGFPLDHPSYFDPMFKEDYLNIMKEEARRAVSPSVLDEDELHQMAEQAFYLKQASEVEARNTQERMGMSAAERRRSLAVNTEDVQRQDQIISRAYTNTARKAGQEPPNAPLYDERTKTWTNPLDNLTPYEKQVMKDYLGKKTLAGMNREGPLGAYKEKVLTQAERNARRKSKMPENRIESEPIGKQEPSKPKPFDPKYFQ